MACIVAFLGLSYPRPMKRISFYLSLMLASVTLCFTAGNASATTMRYKTIRELVQSSDVTLLGEPLESQSFWQGTRIMTRVRVQVQEIWAGRRPEHHVVEVLTAGGVVGEIGQRVDGAAVLPQGQQMVLHLKRHDGDYWPTAMAQGVWVVREGPQANKLMRPGADRLVYGLSHQEGNAQAQVMAREPKTLAELRAAVEEASCAP